MGILNRILGKKSIEKEILTRAIERQFIRFECESKVIRDLNLQGRGLSIGVGTGMLLGIALGVSINNIGAGMAIGLTVGGGIGIAVDQYKIRKEAPDKD